MGAMISKESASADTFEKDLVEFETKLRHCLRTLTELKLEEGKVLYWVTVYGLSIWGILLALVFTDRIPLSFFGSLGNFEIIYSEEEKEKAAAAAAYGATNVKGEGNLYRSEGSIKESTMALESFFRTLLRLVVVLFGPIILFKLRHLVSWYYARRRTQIEDEIEMIRQKQKDKIEELKNITEFYRAKQLIDRYETSIQRIENDVPTDSMINSTRSLSFTKESSVPSYSNTSLPAMDPNLPPTMAVFEEPKTMEETNSNWFNKLLDRIVVGKEIPNTQYALICSHCYHHNGLALPEHFMTCMYRCRACHSLNGPPVEPTPPNTPLLHTPKTTQPPNNPPLQTPKHSLSPSPSSPSPSPSPSSADVVPDVPVQDKIPQVISNEQ